MGAGVGHGATAEVVHQVLKFRTAQGIVGLDGVAANGLRNGVLAEAEVVDFLSGGFEFIHQLNHKTAGIGDLHKWRQCVEQKGAFAEFREADAQPNEVGQLFTEKMGVAHGKFDGLREEQFLGGSVTVLFQTIEHLFEQNALMGGVLVEQDHAAIGFEDDVEFADDSHETQGDVEEGGGGG
jgi:hypothetical protein